MGFELTRYFLLYMYVYPLISGRDVGRLIMTL